MIISQAGLDLIKEFEGFSPVPYLCPANKRTIGYGHVIRNGEIFPNSISHRQGEIILQNDLTSACNSVNRLIIVPLKQGQFDALVSFTFNLGAGSLQASTLRQCINRGDYDEAPKQFMRWVYAGGRKLTGLAARRKAEVFLWEGL